MGNSASSLPYSIGKQVSIGPDGWVLHEGSRKSDGAAVSVFVAKKPALNKTLYQNSKLSQLAPALHHFSNCKRLRHPHILTVHATLDTDHPTAADGTASATNANVSTTSTAGDLIIVTEPCIPLDTWLQSSPPPEQVTWGIEAIVRALHFLHASANLVHGNVSPQAFYVTPAGDVKLWNFALMTALSPEGGVPAHFRHYEGLVTPQPYRSPERHEQQWEAIAAAGIHAMDSYSLGTLIADHFYNHQVPAPLVKAVQRLQTSNLKMRPRLQPLLKCPIFNTPYQKLQLQLEEFAVQPIDQKVAFWHNLLPSLQAGLIPNNVATYKLLPLMKQAIETTCNSDALKAQDMYRRELSTILPPMFYIAEQYSHEEFGKQLTFVIGLLFTVNDRGVRGVLLQKGPVLAKYLDKAALNQAVFEPMCSGFSDSSAALRELTLKATLDLLPHLYQPNLEKLSRYLVRLQSDTEPTIRTNTVIFFAKLSPHLTEISRQKLLLPAFTRALKDPFMPCRLAALSCVLRVKSFFDPATVASKVLPVVTPCLLDSAIEVRREAFSVVDDLLFLLRQESERMTTVLPAKSDHSVQTATSQQSQPKEPVIQAQAAPVIHAPASSSGGYLGGVSSWLSSSAKPSDKLSAPSSDPSSRMSHATVTSTRTVPNVGSLSQTNDVDDSLNEIDEDWGDDDLDLSNQSMNHHAQTLISSGTGQSNTLFIGAPTGDDFFNSFDDKPVKPAAMGKKSSIGKLAVPSKKATTKMAAAVTKLTVEDDVEDGWDDF